MLIDLLHIVKPRSLSEEYQVQRAPA
jgi:hypothetical protein